MKQPGVVIPMRNVAPSSDTLPTDILYFGSCRLDRAMGLLHIDGAEVWLAPRVLAAIKEMAESETQEPAPSSLFPEDVATASEVTPGESQALLGSSFVETHDDNDASERLIDGTKTRSGGPTRRTSVRDICKP